MKANEVHILVSGKYTNLLDKIEDGWNAWRNSKPVRFNEETHRLEFYDSDKKKWIRLEIHRYTSSEGTTAYRKEQHEAP